MKRYIVKPNGATDPMDLFLVEVSGSYISTTAKIYQRGSYPAAKDYTIDGPVIREDFSNDETVEVYRKWDGCTEVSMDEHFCGSAGGAQFDTLALMMKTGVFLCDQMIAADEVETNGGTFEAALQRCDCDAGAEENPGITFEEFSEEVEAAAEKDREKYRHYIEGPIFTEASERVAANFDNVVMGISTAGSTPFDFLKTDSFPRAVAVNEVHYWSDSTEPAKSYLDADWARSIKFIASTAGAETPKEKSKDKRKAQKRARKQNRKK